MGPAPEDATNLAAACYRRRSPEVVRDVFRQLGIDAPGLLLPFYLAFQGPFFSKKIGFELLDLIEQDENIQTVTQVCREEFGFPREALVLMDLVANAVLVYDTRTDRVFNVDMEGGDIEFIQGRLDAKWNSFEAFLEFYFS